MSWTESGSRSERAVPRERRGHAHQLVAGRRAARTFTPDAGDQRRVHLAQQVPRKSSFGSSGSSGHTMRPRSACASPGSDRTSAGGLPGCSSDEPRRTSPPKTSAVDRGHEHHRRPYGRGQRGSGLARRTTPWESRRGSTTSHRPPRGARSRSRAIVAHHPGPERMLHRSRHGTAQLLRAPYGRCAVSVEPSTGRRSSARPWKHTPQLQHRRQSSRRRRADRSRRVVRPRPNAAQSRAAARTRTNADARAARPARD